MSDIHFIIINDYSPYSVSNVQALASQAPGITVYQDTPELELWNNVYGGQKDDFLIFDRCGKQTYHIQLPQSMLTKHDTQWALYNTYHSNICSCNLHRRAPRRHHKRHLGRHHQGQHDTHSPRRTSRSRRHLMRSRSSRCGGDTMCRIYNRLLRHNPRRSQNWIHRNRQH